MMFEDAQFAWEMSRISPELTCTCDEFHTCQQCYEEYTGLSTPNVPHMRETV